MQQGQATAEDNHLGQGLSPWRRSAILPVLLILGAGVAAYSNSLSGPFVLDDVLAIPENPTIRHLWPIGDALSPPAHGQTVGGRPVLNLSFALNYAFSGTNTRGYHLTNLAIHILNGLLLAGILRRTFQTASFGPAWREAGPGLALAIAMLWTVHPIQTESVTYIVQRAESLATLFYLLVMYCVLVGATSGRDPVKKWGQAPRWAPFPEQRSTSARSQSPFPHRRRPWIFYLPAVLACSLGAATKEIVVTAPVVVLLYDRTFLAGSFKEAWRQRRGLYLGLMASWLVLAGLMFIFTGRGKTAGFGQGIAPWEYALTQSSAILHYLRLTFWPSGLCFDYGTPIANTWREILPGAALVVGLVLTTAWALVRRPRLGFLGAFFLLVIAPSSSILPVVTQTMAEHRMYLPLAAILTLAVVCGFAALQRLAQSGRLGVRPARVLGVCAVVLASVALGVTTYRRNEAYRTVMTIWEDTVAKAPGNVRAQNNFGNLLAQAGRLDQAVAHLKEAVRIQPDYCEAHNNLGAILPKLGRQEEAAAHLREALRLQPGHAPAHSNLAALLVDLGRPEEALEHFRLAAQRMPASAELHASWGDALCALGRFDDAVDHYHQSLRLRPDFAEVHAHLAVVFVQTNRAGDAIPHYEALVRLRPDDAEGHFNFGVALTAVSRVADAIRQFEQAVRLAPDFGKAHFNLSLLLARTGQIRPAIRHGLQSARLLPNEVYVQETVALLVASHEPSEGADPAMAVQLAERACDLTNRQDMVALNTLAAALASAGKFDLAVATAKEAWRLAQAAGNQPLAQEIHLRLQLYRNRKPYREPSAPTPAVGR